MMNARWSMTDDRMTDPGQEPVPGTVSGVAPPIGWCASAGAFDAEGKTTGGERGKAGRLR